MTKSQAKMLDTASAFFFFNEIPSPSCAAGPAVPPMRGRSTGPCPGEGSNVHPSLAQVAAAKAKVNFACEGSARLTIIFNEDENC